MIMESRPCSMLPGTVEPGVSPHGQTEATTTATLTGMPSPRDEFANSDLVELSTLHEGPRIRKHAERDMQLPCFTTGNRRNDYRPRLVLTLIVKLCNHLSRLTDPEIIHYHDHEVLYHVCNTKGWSCNKIDWHYSFFLLANKHHSHSFILFCQISLFRVCKNACAL